MSDKRPKNDFVSDFDDELDFKSGSFMDCTGIMPSLPQDDYEYDSYEDVYDFMPPDSRKKDSLK